MRHGGIAVNSSRRLPTIPHVRVNILSYFNKCGGSLRARVGQSGVFDHKCHFKIPGDGIDPEEFELEMIDHGVEEIFKEEDSGIMVYANFPDYGRFSTWMRRASR